MKLVVAIVRPDRVSAILEELYKAEVQGLTLSRVQGHGGEREHVETYRGMSVKMELSEKVRLEIGVSNHFVEPTVQAVLRGAPVPGLDQVPRDIDTHNICAEFGGRQRRRAIAASEIQHLHSFRDSEF